jgi:hypothetical protein
MHGLPNQSARQVSMHITHYNKTFCGPLVCGTDVVCGMKAATVILHIMQQQFLL